MIFDIQRFSLHDGKGIRTLIFYKGCPLRCQWCSNPESQDFGYSILYDRGKCKDFGDCMRVESRTISRQNGHGLNISRDQISDPLNLKDIFERLMPSAATWATVREPQRTT